MPAVHLTVPLTSLKMCHSKLYVVFSIFREEACIQIQSCIDSFCTIYTLHYVHFPSILRAVHWCRGLFTRRSTLVPQTRFRTGDKPSVIPGCCLSTPPPTDKLPPEPPPQSSKPPPSEPSPPSGTLPPAEPTMPTTEEDEVYTLMAHPSGPCSSSLFLQY